MANSLDALDDNPCTVTGIRAINEPGEGLVELEITVGCNRASLTFYLGTGFTLASMQSAEMATEAGVNIQTLRYYERRGLLAPPE